MIDEKVQKYVDYITKELIALKNGQFTGNITFKVSFMLGGIGNMNIGINQSVKLDTRRE